MNHTIPYTQLNRIRSGMTLYRVLFHNGDVEIRTIRPLGKFHLGKKLDTNVVGCVELAALHAWIDANQKFCFEFDVQEFAKANPGKIKFGRSAEVQEDPNYVDMQFSRNSFWYARSNNDGVRKNQYEQECIALFHRRYDVGGVEYGTVIVSNFRITKQFTETGLIPTAGNKFGSGLFTNKKAAEKFASRLRANDEWMQKQRDEELEYEHFWDTMD